MPHTQRYTSRLSGIIVLLKSLKHLSKMPLKSDDTRSAPSISAIKKILHTKLERQYVCILVNISNCVHSRIVNILLKQCQD